MYMYFVYFYVALLQPVLFNSFLFLFECLVMDFSTGSSDLKKFRMNAKMDQDALI